jgi:hypothetical protein
VLTVALLDGPRAATLLSGVCEGIRPAALEALRGLEQCSRAERHARLASALAWRPVPLVATAGIPGRLGAEVREALAGDPSSEAGRTDSATACWARRLLLELAGA